MTKTNGIRIIGITVLCLLLLIVVLQNTERVETKVLFASIAMPRALLLFVTFMVGVVTGLVLATYYASRKTRRGKTADK